MAGILEVVLRDERVDFEKAERRRGIRAWSDLPLELALEALVKRVALPVGVESVPVELNARYRRQEAGATRQAGVPVRG